MKYIVSFIMLIISIIIGGLFNIYIHHYNQDSNNTAVSGLVFKTSLNLSEYKNVSNGNDVWGNFNRYSRSDRHTEAITVYCNKYCK